MPVWKHAYHMLHACDPWYINPMVYKEPLFHVSHLNALHMHSEKALIRNDLVRCLDCVQAKIMDDSDTPDDEMPYEVPSGCKSDRRV